MCRILGYGEDVLTLWALENHIPDVLKTLEDQTDPSDCLVFFRPSFGRGRAGTAGFGEFDAILATSGNVYLIESKWDAFRRSDARTEIHLRESQKLRHKVFRWYLMHWDTKYSDDWKRFIRDHNTELQDQFGKKLASSGKLLAQNLENVLTRICEHCGKPKLGNIRNVLLFFYDKEIKSSPPSKVTENFELVSLDYSQALHGNFIILEKLARESA